MEATAIEIDLTKVILEDDDLPKRCGSCYEPFTPIHRIIVLGPRYGVGVEPEHRALLNPRSTARVCTNKKCRLYTDLSKVPTWRRRT